MSVYHHCIECGAGFETGLGDDRNRCRDCRRVAGRLAAGGRDLGARERAAVASLFDGMVTHDNRVLTEPEALGALVCADDMAADFASDEWGRLEVF